MNVGKINYGPQFEGKLKYRVKRNGIPSFNTIDATKIVKFEKYYDAVKIDGAEGISYVQLEGDSMRDYADFLAVYNEAVKAPDKVIITYNWNDYC